MLLVLRMALPFSSMVKFRQEEYCRRIYLRTKRDDRMVKDRYGFRGCCLEGLRLTETCTASYNGTKPHIISIQPKVSGKTKNSSS